MSTQALQRARAALGASVALVVLVIAMLVLLSGCQRAVESPTETAISDESTQFAPYGLQTGLPARATKTPTMQNPSQTALIVPTAISSPVVTSPFSFPTSPPTAATLSTPDCTAIFPIESIEAIRFGQTTTAQLEASFGHAVSVGGRATTFRFESRGCVLNVSVAGGTAQEAELVAYGTLDWLMDRYGAPVAVGICEGNLVLLIPGQTVLLYPDQGMIATFDALPDDIRRDTPIAALYARPAYEVERQIARLKLLVVEDWVPPLR